MSLTPEERQCIEALCGYLGAEQGSVWAIGDDSLDARHHNEPSPEATISNGIGTVAVEVKRIMGTDEDTHFHQQLTSLRRRLRPSRPGTYVLIVPPGWILPWSRSFIRMIRTEMERICWELVPDQVAYLKVLRKAKLSKLQLQGQFVHCSHGSDAVPGLSRLVRGVYLLRDGRPDHQFHTDETRHQCLQRLLAATAKVEIGGREVLVEWQEDWELRFFEGDTPKVQMAGFVQMFWVKPAVREAMRLRIRDANKKFGRRYAARHAVILDNDYMFVGLSEVFGAFESLDAEEYQNVDDVYQYEGGAIKRVFSRE